MRFRLLAIVLPIFIASCADREILVVKPDAVNVGTARQIFVATNRDMRADGAFNLQRSSEVAYQRVTVSVPPSHEPGLIKTRHENPNPERHFTISDIKAFDGQADYQAALRRAVPKASSDITDVTFFVHGFNTSYSEAVYRHAQILHDADAPGAQVTFSWPSAAKVLGYAHDQDSILFSRDGLQEAFNGTFAFLGALVLTLDIVLGAMLAMETLRQTELKQPGWARRNLAGVVLIAPDIDLDVFKNQLESIQTLPEPFIVFVSERDRALEISGLINGREKRLGNDSDISQLGDYPILFFDITDFANGVYGDHFTIATSPEMLGLFKSGGLQKLIQNGAGQLREIAVGGRRIGVSAKRVNNAIKWVLSPASEPVGG